MSKPPWYREAIARHGAELAADGDRHVRAVADVIAVIGEHPEFLEDLVGRDLGRWVREHESSGDLFQASLFPLIPVTMQVAPARFVKTAAMTAADLDKAQRMLMSRTQNAIDGADRERAEFAGFYEQVRPLLKGDLTVSEVLTQLAAEKAA